MRVVDLTGKVFGRLTVIERAGSDKFGNSAWLCLCQCGNKIVVSKVHLSGGSVKSCGCLRKENPNYKTHQKSNTRIYKCYRDMLQRCYYKKCNRYYRYGGRGIKVCEEWLRDNGFVNFYNWAIENGYTENLTLDRINANGNYEPSNCRWADKITQANNKTTTVYLLHNGNKYTISELARIYNTDYKKLYRRCRTLGWTIEKALNTP